LSTPKDWEGRTVGYKGTPPPDLFALLHAAGADPAKVALVNVGFDPRVLTEGQVDVYPLFKSNEPFLIRKWGYDLTLWDAADYGVPTLGLAYVSSEAFIEEHPEALVRFLRAALRGVEVVYHLASAEHLGARGDVLSVDGRGTANLARAAAEMRVRRFFYVSHLDADRASYYPLLRVKGIAEEHIRRSGVPYTIFRSALLYG
ncbi:MAG: hypothetical protein CUN48_15855, partial [Candidatus Thermofonsia Clade 3 bacterium]